MKGKRRQSILIKGLLSTLVGKKMTTIFIFILFITQVISFYFLAILYMKVSKYDDFEEKQKRLMEEVDDSLAAYLAEVQDENDRLIKSIISVQGEKRNRDEVEEVDVESIVSQKDPSLEESPPINITTPKIPMNQVLRSYGKMEYEPIEEVEVALEIDDRTRAIGLHNEGKSIEEIARILGKGRTEVELILKFR